MACFQKRFQVTVFSEPLMLGCSPLLDFLSRYYFLKICLSGIQVSYQTVYIQIMPNIFSLNLASAVDKVYQRNSFSRQISDALYVINSLLTSVISITFANNLDPDQVQQSVGNDLDPNCLTLY